MTLMQSLVGWIESFAPRAIPDVRRQEQQEREAAALLRQLRAELRLMRHWRDTEREERGADGR